MRFDNILVTTGQVARTRVPGVVRTTLATAGLSVEVTIETGVGFAPDLMLMRAQRSYDVKPLGVLVDEGASGRMRVVLAPTS